MTDRSQLSIIIVAYENAGLLRQCVSSLYKHLPDNFFELIVVSNRFSDDDKHRFLQSFPAVQWIDMLYNAGYARANNAGIKIAKGNTFLLLNPDTIALNADIETCYHRLAASPYVAAGVQLLNADFTPQIPGSFFVKGGLNHLLPIPYWGDFIRWLGYKTRSKIPNVQQAKALEEVDWISGAFLMVKQEAVEKAGMLDEDFFLYAEEVEWCSRLKRAGKLVIYGDLKLIHLEGATINKSQNINEKGYYNLYGKKGLQLMVSNHLRVRKQYGINWFGVLLLNYTFGFFVFALCGTLHCFVSLRNPLPLWKKVGAFGRNLFRLWLLTPTILRNKPHFYKMF